MKAVAETLDASRGNHLYNLLDDNLRRFNAGVPTIAVPHVVPVPPVEGSVQLETLEGVSLADLVTRARSPFASA